MSERTVRSVTLALLLACAPAVAQTQTADNERQAQERYERAIKLFDAARGDAKIYEAALAEFEAAHRLFPAFEILFNIGVTQKRLGRFGAALKTFERYLAEGGDKVAPARREAVAREVAEIRSLVAEVTVQVEPASPPADLWLDGRPIGKAPLAEPLLLVSGTYVFKATREGATPDEEQLRVLSGNSYAVKLTLTASNVGRLVVETVPAGASLVLDDRPLGVAPWKGDVEAGGHKLVASLEGYDPRELELVVAAGQARSVSLELSQPAPWYKRWYVWTGVSVLAVGAAGGIWYAAQPRADQIVRVP